MIKRQHNVLETSEIPQVAMDLMNEVHKEELTLVNNLNGLLEEAPDIESFNDDITAALETWIEHTKAHFNRENSMMVECQFPAYHCHFHEHEQALQGLNSVYQHWLDNPNPEELAEYVRNVWPQWFVNHIASMDVVTSAFISQRRSEP